MARQIKETPVLEGTDAQNFLQEIKDNENKRVPSHDYNRAIENYKKIKFSDGTN